MLTTRAWWAPGLRTMLVARRVRALRRVSGGAETLVRLRTGSRIGRHNRVAHPRPPPRGGARFSETRAQGNPCLDKAQGNSRLERTQADPCLERAQGNPRLESALGNPRMERDRKSVV